MNEALYKVSAGDRAHTLVYEDGLGSIYFVFDITAPQDGNQREWNLWLHPRALTSQGQPLAAEASADAGRVTVAYERTLLYARSRGFAVKRAPAPGAPKPESNPWQLTPIGDRNMCKS
jgi:hypothetical protein